MTGANAAASKAAKFLLLIAQEYRSIETTESERRYLFMVAKWAVREFEPFFLTLKCSKAAALMARRNGLSFEGISWKKRDKIKIDGRKAFHYEHLIEVAAATHEVMAAQTQAEIAAILLEQQVAWITTDELERLMKQDKKRKGSGGPDLRDRNCWLDTLQAAKIAVPGLVPLSPRGAVGVI